MYAIFENGGKQYKVKKDDVIKLEKFDCKKDQILKINIAHNEGNYFTNIKHLEELEKENLIAFKYCDEKGNITEESNPNGSLENIAGIYNSNKNIHLPDVIKSPKDLYIQYKNFDKINYISNKSITSKIIIYNKTNIKKNYDGIVCIENADPGFDFLFSKNIKKAV